MTSIHIYIYTYEEVAVKNQRIYFIVYWDINNLQGYWLPNDGSRLIFASYIWLFSLPRQKCVSSLPPAGICNLLFFFHVSHKKIYIVRSVYKKN